MGKNIKSTVPDWVIYPEKEWVRIKPAQAGFDAAMFNQILANSSPNPGGFGGVVPNDAEWGSVLTR